MIDTGANFSAIFRHTAERVGVHMEDASARQHGSGRGIGPQTVASVRMKLDTVDVGDLEFTNMPVEVLDDRRGDEVEMLLGEEFQRRVHLWISYSSHTLIMQYPPTASKATSREADFFWFFYFKKELLSACFGGATQVAPPAGAYCVFVLFMAVWIAASAPFVSPLASALRADSMARMRWLSSGWFASLTGVLRSRRRVSAISNA
jgi:hypothetical protein